MKKCNLYLLCALYEKWLCKNCAKPPKRNTLFGIIVFKYIGKMEVKMQKKIKYVEHKNGTIAKMVTCVDGNNAIGYLTPLGKR